MPRHITIIQGHPDPQETHLCHALAYAYADAAIKAGHEVRHVIATQLEYPMLRNGEEWRNGPVPESVQAAQSAIVWSDHLLIVFPLWLGTMPATLKAFFEQVLRPGFALETQRQHRWTRKLGGRSAHVVVTMGMPATVFRAGFGAHGVRCFVRNILRFVGIAPVRTSYIGGVESRGCADHWLRRMRQEGARAH